MSIEDDKSEFIRMLGRYVCLLSCLWSLKNHYYRVKMMDVWLDGSNFGKKLYMNQIMKVQLFEESETEKKGRGLRQGYSFTHNCWTSTV